MIKIYSQGDLDGACFLYSIANAYKALTRKNVTSRAWSKALNSVLLLEDFMDSTVGTERYNDDALLFEAVINNMLGAFSRKISFEVTQVKCRNIASIKKLISEKAVVIFCYMVEKDGKEIINHWTCGVGLHDSPPGVQVACSSCDTEPQKDNKFSRWYNEIRSSNNVTTVLEESVFQISITS
jgi:hypothetical protein